jgi:hypothetical protein
VNLENSGTEYLRVTGEVHRSGEGRGKGKLAWLGTEKAREYLVE